MMATSPDRIAWITGAGKGIGRALAERMAADGWTVAASARTAADLEDLSAGAPDRIFAFPLDVTDFDASKRTIHDIEEQLGPIDLAVFNAGTHIPLSAETFNTADVRTLMEVNVMGVVHGLDPLISRMISRRSGHLAVVASLAGYRGLPSSSAYGASKAALINMCEALRPELETHGVRLSLINPGFVATPLTDKNDFPMPFLMTAEDAARAISRDLERPGFEISFPKRFAWIMKTLRVLPSALFFALTRRMIRS